MTSPPGHGRRQCDQIGRFWKLFDTIIWSYFENVTFQAKTAAAATFGNFGLLFILTPGHTELTDHN